MWISRVRVRHFRSIMDVDVNLRKDVTLIVGPNSCGKSNLLKAIRLAFLPSTELNQEAAHRNLNAEVRDKPGGPKLSIYVTLELQDVPLQLQQLGGRQGEPTQEYIFRLFRSGTHNRTLAGKVLSPEDFETFRTAFHPIYVPPIRDISSDGLAPFRELLGNALRKARGARSLEPVRQAAESVLEEQATKIFRNQLDVTEGLLRARSLKLDTSGIDLDGLYGNLGVLVDVGQACSVNLQNLGTGHQSAVVMGLYRQLGQYAEGQSVFCFEEPDNHLHPSSIRAVGAQLMGIAETSQVVCTTHSPVLVNYMGMQRVRSLYLDEERHTMLRKADLSDYSEAKLASLLLVYGIRASEPLLSQRVVLVEGASDACVLTRLMFLRSGVTPDQLDVAIVPCSGKNGVEELALFCQRSGVDWSAVLDNDALVRGEFPITRMGIGYRKKQEALHAVSQLVELCDIGTKRGRNCAKTLSHVGDELQTGRPQPRSVQDSLFDRLLRIQRRPNREHTRLLTDVQKGVRARQRVFQETSIFVLSRDLENQLLVKNEAVNIAEQLLIERGCLKAPIIGLDAKERTRRIAGTLHNSGNSAMMLDLVDKMYASRLFARSEFLYLADAMSQSAI